MKWKILLLILMASPIAIWVIYCEKTAITSVEKCNLISIGNSPKWGNYTIWRCGKHGNTCSYDDKIFVHAQNEMKLIVKKYISGGIEIMDIAEDELKED